MSLVLVCKIFAHIILKKNKSRYSTCSPEPTAASSAYSYGRKGHD